MTTIFQTKRVLAPILLVLGLSAMDAAIAEDGLSHALITRAAKIAKATGTTITLTKETTTVRVSGKNKKVNKWAKKSVVTVPGEKKAKKVKAKKVKKTKASRSKASRKVASKTSRKIPTLDNVAPALNSSPTKSYQPSVAPRTPGLDNFPADNSGFY
jgi:hypothetical protein